MIMLLTTVIFIVHDYFLQRESNERKAVLETKRKFVRFISHEIRTPLNTGETGAAAVQCTQHIFFTPCKTSGKKRIVSHLLCHVQYIDEVQ